MNLSEWSSFYVMAGSAAAALTGLMFVVISLVNDQEQDRPSDDEMDIGISAYSTPVVMHLAAAFIFSAVLIVPWRSIVPPAIIVLLIGMYGLAYILRVRARAKQIRTAYEPDLEDFIWYTVIPLCTYAAIIAAGILMRFSSTAGLLLVAAGVLMLIFIGIRNAWDIVTYLAIFRRRQ